MSRATQSGYNSFFLLDVDGGSRERGRRAWQLDQGFLAGRVVTVAHSLLDGAAGQSIRSEIDLAERVRNQREGSSVVATHVVDEERVLRVAPRRSEHVACARGGRIYAAGEFVATSAGEINEVSNQSTGYCPQPCSWAVLQEVLDEAGIAHPGRLTATVEFRRCESCEQRCIVKDDWFQCDVCGAALPRRWNL